MEGIKFFFFFLMLLGIKNDNTSDNAATLHCDHRSAVASQSRLWFFNDVQYCRHVRWRMCVTEVFVQWAMCNNSSTLHSSECTKTLFMVALRHLVPPVELGSTRFCLL